MTTTDELSGIFAATVTTAAGRVVFNEGNEDEIRSWLWHFRRAERLADVDVREYTLAEVNGPGVTGIWTSPGA